VQIIHHIHRFSKRPDAVPSIDPFSKMIKYIQMHLISPRREFPRSPDLARLLIVHGDVLP
jgi:hypothetical protein